MIQRSLWLLDKEILSLYSSAKMEHILKSIAKNEELKSHPLSLDGA
jgi:hypothetical protein